MQKRRYKKKNTKKDILFLPFCAVLAALVAFGCAFLARCGRGETPIVSDTVTATDTISETVSETVSVTVTEEPTTDEPVTTEPPTTTPEETTLTDTTPIDTTDISVTETTTFTSVAEPDGVRRIENFIFLETDTPEYALARALYCEIPPVVKTAEVTETVSTDETLEPPETTAETTARSLETGETAETTVETYTYEIEGEVALYYKDLTDGETWVFAPDKKIFAASMIKAVYAFALLDLAEREEIDMKEALVYTKDKLVEGSGDFAKVEDGTAFTVEELISRTVRRSDNTAFAMLRARFGTAFFTDVMSAQGLAPTRYNSWWRPGVTSYGEFFTLLHGYIVGENKYGKWLGDIMCESLHTVMLKNALRPEKVAHKYGWDIDSYCDGGIVLDNEHPYVLVFMSNLDEGHLKAANNSFIYKVGGLVKEMHDAKYAAAESTVAE